MVIPKEDIFLSQCIQMVKVVNDDITSNELLNLFNDED